MGFFGGGGGGDPFGRGRQRGPSRTKNLVHQLSVSLEDMYNGTIRKLALQKNVICDSCEGIGGNWCCSEMPQLSGNRHAGQNSATWPRHDAADPEYVPGV